MAASQHHLKSRDEAGNRFFRTLISIDTVASTYLVIRIPAWDKGFHLVERCLFPEPIPVEGVIPESHDLYVFAEVNLNCEDVDQLHFTNFEPYDYLSFSDRVLRNISRDLDPEPMIFDHSGSMR